MVRSHVLTLYSGLSGCLWGVLGYFFIVPEYPVVSVMIVMVLTGMVASAIASLSHVLPAFFAFTLPVFLPAAYRFFLFEGEIFSSIALLILIFVLASCYFAVGNHKTLRTSIQLRFDNLDLISNLSLEKQRADEARLRAESANRAKSKFLAAASHDLRQPMHALKLFTTELEERTQKTVYQPIVKNIGLSVDALEDLFNALLDISKLDAGTLSVSKEHFRLQNLFDRLGNDGAGLAVEKGLQLEITPSKAVVFSDPILLIRILGNLLNNALCYTTSGKVSISAVTTNAGVYIQVRDTGRGIAREDQVKIFEEFTQLHNPERDRNKGLGLGLSIVRRIALLLDYPLSLDSALGKGSVFSLTVPPGEEQALPVIEVCSDPKQSLSQLFVLVIEDEPIIREGIASLLKHWQCLVLVAGSVEQALLELTDYEYSPDVILADYRLRAHATGIEAIALIRSLYGELIPALIITGDSDPDRLKEANANAIPLMHKPFEPEQLRAFLGGVAKQLRSNEQQSLEKDITDMND